ncbi:hypothetical protein D3C71_1596300 [compost metagenome]
MRDDMLNHVVHIVRLQLIDHDIDRVAGGLTPLEQPRLHHSYGACANAGNENVPVVSLFYILLKLVIAPQIINRSGPADDRHNVVAPGRQIREYGFGYRLTLVVSGNFSGLGACHRNDDSRLLQFGLRKKQLVFIEPVRRNNKQRLFSHGYLSSTIFVYGPILTPFS